MHYSVKGLVMLEIIPISLFVLYIALYIYKPHDSALRVVIVLLIIIIFLYVWHKSIRISVKNGVFEYRSIFRKRIIRIDDIREAYIQVGLVGWKDYYRSSNRLMIRPKSGSHVKEFYISIWVFNLEDMRKLMDLLPMRD